MPLLRPSPSDYTTVVKSLANAGAAVTNPQGFRPPSKSSVAFVNVSSVAALIRGSPFRLIEPRAAAAAPAPAVVEIVPLANAGGDDIFVVKYDSDGTPLWARRIGGSGTDLAYSVTTDSTGNVLVGLRYLSISITIFAADGTTAFMTFGNPGVSDGVIVKYNSDGTPQWARRIGGSGNELILGVDIDSTGNIVVAGRYNSSPVTIYDTDGISERTTLANAGSTDAFIIEYNSSGDFQWARRIGGTGDDIANAVAIDSTGNIIVVGPYGSNPLPIYGASASFTTLTDSITSNNAFVVKYNSDGTPQWARQITGTGAETANSVSTDSTGNIIVAGAFSSTTMTISGSSTSLTLNSVGTNDGFIAQYNSSGEPQWVRQIAGTSANIYNLTIDSTGNIIVAGTFSSTTVTISGSSTSLTLNRVGNNDGFIAQYNSSGEPQWVKQIAGTGWDTAFSVSTDSSGNIVVCGSYTSNPLTIYNAAGSTEFTLANVGNSDCFVIKYNSSGTLQWAKRLGGTGSEVAYSVTTDSTGNIVVAGYYTSNPLTIT